MARVPRMRDIQKAKSHKDMLDLMARIDVLENEFKKLKELFNPSFQFKQNDDEQVKLPEGKKK